MYETKDSGARAKFETGAQRDTSSGKGRYDLLPIHAIHRLAQLYERGAVKYDARNWEKGIPVGRMYDSLIRHAFQALSGDQSEDHLAGVVFNALGIMEYEERADRWDDNRYSNLFQGMGPLYERNNPKRMVAETPPSPVVEEQPHPPTPQELRDIFRRELDEEREELVRVGSRHFPMPKPEEVLRRVRETEARAREEVLRRVKEEEERSSR